MDLLFRHAALAFALVLPAARADQILPTPQVDCKGNLKFRGGPTLVKVTGSVLDLAGQNVTPAGRSVATALSTRFSKQKLISDYGAASGDGSDATAAFTAAMADGTSPTIYIPEGTYTLVGCPAFSASSNVSFVGAGMDRSVIRLATAGTVCNGSIFTWVGRPSVQLRGLSFDLNGATQNQLQGAALALFGADGLVYDDMALVGMAGQNWNGAAISGGLHGRITNSRFALNACSGNYNHGLALVNSFAPAVDWKISGNTFINTAPSFTVSDQLSITQNEISGWCYGAGVTLADQGTTDVHALVANNKIHDSGIGADGDATYPSGIESWAYNATIVGNKIWNAASQCVVQSGQFGHVEGNACHGWGKGGIGSGQTAYGTLYANSASNGSGSSFIANSAYDDGSGNSRYAYQDASGVTGILVKGNSFRASAQPYKIVGGSVVDDPGAMTTVSALGVCTAENKGSLMSVSDATNTTRGTTVSGGGGGIVNARCSGSAWLTD